MGGGGRALVLGGGGVTGVAWEVGLLHGLATAGVDLGDADLFVGTSAGSVVAAQLTSGVPLEKLFADQVAEATGEVTAQLGLGVIARFLVASAWPGERERGRAWLGRAALRSKTVPEEQRRKIIAGRVPYQLWPNQRLLVTAVDAESGEARIFDRESGVPLVDAVAASCAVPVVWPPITIDGRRYIDGGVRTVANVDLAAGYERVVVVAPVQAALRRADRPTAQAAALGRDVRSVVVTPDAGARAAIGRNMLDPARRVPSARAGLAQAEAVAERVSAVWG